jgi:uncharacterized membrane protein YozB (DUF420 family)
VPRSRGVLGSIGRDHTGRYGWLLLLILSAVAIQLILPGTTVGTVAVIALQAATVIAALGVVETRPRPRHVVVSVVIVAALFTVLLTVLEPFTTVADDLTSLIARTTGLLLAAGVPVIIARDVAQHRRITMQTVAAGLCVYLLLGLAFGFAHGLVDLTVADAYTDPLGEDDAVYLSFVTLTTVGFGDLTPVAGLARALAVVEAVVGQIYLVSIVALLVGNVGLTRTPGEYRGPGPRRGARSGPPPDEPSAATDHEATDA